MLGALQVSSHILLKTTLKRWTTLGIERGQVTLPIPQDLSMQMRRQVLTPQGNWFSSCFCDRHGVNVTDVPAERKLLLMGAAAGISSVLSTHVLCPLVPAQGPQVAGQRCGGFACSFHEDLCPSGLMWHQLLDSGPVTYSYQVSGKVLGEGYFAV